METIEPTRYASKEQIPMGEEGMVPCPRCSGWTLVRRGRFTLVLPCLPCRQKLMRDVPYKPTPLNGTLETDAQGRTYFRPDRSKVAPWQRLSLPLEYAELSLLEPDAVQDRRRAKNKFVPPESRRAGITYVTSDTGWNAVCALQSLLKGDVAAVGLFGHNGTGKSRMLYAAAQDFVKAGRSVYILDGEKLHHYLTSDADDAKLRGRAMAQRATDADVLLWDELGYTGSHTKEWLPDSVLTEITHVIYRREASNLPTVFVSNALAAGLQKRLGAPVWSRIEGMCGRNMFWLVGPDDFNYRAEGKARNNVLPFQR